MYGISCLLNSLPDQPSLRWLFPLVIPATTSIPYKWISGFMKEPGVIDA